MKQVIQDPNKTAQSLIDKYTAKVGRSEDLELSHAQVLQILQLPVDDAALVLISAGEAGRWAHGYHIVRAITNKFAKSPATAKAVFDAFEVKE